MLTITTVTNDIENTTEPTQFVFPGGEVQVRLDPTFDYICDDVYVDAIIKSSDDLMALLLLKDALDFRMNQHTQKHLVMKYMPYARQDRRCAPGESDALCNVIIPLIDSLGFDDIEIYDIHNQETLKKFKRTRVTHIEQWMIVNKFLNRKGYNAIICPDAGAAKKIAAIRSSNVIMYKKYRDPQTGEITRIAPIETTAMTQIFLAHRETPLRVCVIDDICDGGRTFIEVAHDFKQRADEYKIDLTLDLYVTHGIFSKGVDVLFEQFDNVFTTNSLGAQDPRIQIIEK